MFKAQKCRCVFSLLPIVAISACASKSLTSGSASFAEAVQLISNAHDTQMEQVAANRLDRLLTEHAQKRAVFVESDGCVKFAISPEDFKASDCTLLLQGNAPIDKQPIERDNLLALSKALRNYAGALALVAADTTEDRAAFAASVQKLGASLGSLDGQIARLSQGSGLGKDKIGTVAGLVAEAGGLYLDYQRTRFLRELIPAADPFVQKAVAILEFSRVSGQGALMATLAKTEISASLRALQDLVNNPRSKPKQIKSAQIEALKAHERFIAASRVSKSFKSIGEAHAAMVEASRSGLSGDEVLTMIDRLLTLAGQVDATLEAFNS